MAGGTGFALVVAAAVGMMTYSARDVDPPTSVPEVERAGARPIVSLATPSAPRGANLNPAKREEPLSRERVVTLGNGDTLIEVLLRAGLSQREAYAASEALRKVYDPRDLRAGQTFSLFIGEHDAAEGGPSLKRLELVPATDRLVAIDHLTEEAFATRTSKIPHTRKLVSGAGTIRSSLYDAARAADVPAAVLVQAYGTLSYGLDFQRDLRDGDTFQIAFEVFDDGLEQGRHSGDLVYAAISLSDQSLRILRYTTADGFTGFFDDKGASIETSLMKTPVDGGRLSSPFGKRDHPVLKYTRMHRGLDFTAPRGTPVLAAGDGIVVRRSRNGSFGKYVEIEHDANYATAYAHLSRYAEGLEPGARVRQGDVIGYIGATGLATGPNLHYEVLQNGEQVDPLRLELPPRRILEGDDLERFEQAKAELRAALARAPSGERNRWTAMTQPTAAASTGSY